MVVQKEKGSYHFQYILSLQKKLNLQECLGTFFNNVDTLQALYICHSFNKVLTSEWNSHNFSLYYSSNIFVVLQCVELKCITVEKRGIIENICLFIWVL